LEVTALSLLTQKYQEIQLFIKELVKALSFSYYHGHFLKKVTQKKYTTVL